MVENSEDCTPVAATARMKKFHQVYLLSADGAAVGHYVLIVFFDGAGEAVMARGVGDEVVVLALRGMHGRFESALAGIADGAGRESRVFVGVVGGVELHVRMVQLALISASEQLGINNAGVGVERDSLCQAVV